MRPLYSASAFELFAFNFALAAMMLIVAGLCVAWIFIRRPAWERHLTGGRPKTGGRPARLAAIALMLIAQLAGIVVLVDAGRALVSGPQVVTSPLRARYERQCGARTMRCDYAEFAAREDVFLRVAPFAYDLMLEGRCYKTTYFGSLFDIYPSGYIAEIVRMPAASCAS